jgi:hypothetical protein
MASAAQSRALTRACRVSQAFDIWGGPKQPWEKRPPLHELLGREFFDGRPVSGASREGESWLRVGAMALGQRAGKQLARWLRCV